MHHILFATAVSLACAAQDAAPPSRELSLELTSTNRLAGTVGSLTGAQIVAHRLGAAGWKVELDEHEVMLALPKRIEVDVFADKDAKQPLMDRVARFDADAIPPGDVPLYNAWTASGHARAPVVDVGFGLKADYERLEKAGVDVRGCIALAKYGHAYRGIKAEEAQRHGCVGVLQYSDPKSDGGEKGKVWPEGPWKPDTEAQRGSIYPIELAPGDPTTPGWASSKHGVDGKRLSRDEVDAKLPKILCTPIGAREASAIQARLKKNDAGEALGPGPVEVELALDVPREMRTIRNVIATLPGLDDQLVIAGAHRDAWVRGAQDSGSGCVVLERVAQHLSERVKTGWKPQHTIQLAFWDAEEFGLIGSTEWGEANEQLLRDKCLVYVNCDACVSGTKVSASGAPGMMAPLKKVFEKLENADASMTLWDEWCASFDDRKPRFSLPGAGSDHTVFIHHLCIPVLEVGFGGNDGGGYHTAFDDFALMDRFLDPGWIGHELCATTLTELLAAFAAQQNAGFDPAEAAGFFAVEAKKLVDDIPEALGLSIALERISKVPPELISSTSKLRRFYATLGCEDGIDPRHWFRNRLWAPALDNGYGSTVFPTVHTAAGIGKAALKFDLDAINRAIAEMLMPVEGDAPDVDPLYDGSNH